MLIIILQLIEEYLVYPRVVGKRVGLPSLWVLVSFTIGSGALGVIGMLISVPICAVVYQLLKEAIEKRKAAQLMKSEERQNEAKFG